METIKTALARVELSPTEMDKWEKTCTAFLWHCPSFAHIFYELLDRSGSKTIAVFTNDPRIRIAATDGIGIAFNPVTYFENYNLHQRVFILCHEVSHCIFDHPNMLRKLSMAGEIVYPDGIRLPFIKRIMGWAADYVINDTLRDCGHGKMPDDALWDQAIGTWEEAVIDVYRKMYEQMKKQGKLKQLQIGQGAGNPGQGQDGQGGQNPDQQGQDGKDDQHQPNGNGPPGSGQQQFDELLEPGTIDGKDAVAAAMERNEAEWQTTIATAAQMARLQGNLPGSLKRMFSDILEPQVPWNEQVETLVARRMGSDGYSWRRADRRLIIRDCYAPGRSGHGAKLIVCGADTSGSIGDEEMDMWFAELAGIFDDLKPEELVIMWCDASVHDVSNCDEPSDLNVIRHRGVGGGGGTDFRPVFDMIDELGMTPDALIYLTDGHGPFPDAAPSFPVIWGSTVCQPDHYPFGDVVMVPKQAPRT